MPVPLYYRGIILCIFSGLMYGQMFTGAAYIQDHIHDYPEAKKNANGKQCYI